MASSPCQLTTAIATRLLFRDLSHFPSLTVLIQINRVVFALVKLVLNWLVPHLQIDEGKFIALSFICEKLVKTLSRSLGVDLQRSINAEGFAAGITRADDSIAPRPVPFHS